MEDAIKLLEAEIIDRQRRGEGLLAQANLIFTEMREIQDAINTLRKFNISKGAFEATQQMVTQVNGTAIQSQEKVVSAPVTPPEPETPSTVVTKGQETAIKPEPPVERGQSIDLRKGKWSDEKKRAASLKRRQEHASRIPKGTCPLSIKGNNLFHAGVYLDDLDQDERFIMVDLIRDFGFEVLRSMMRGTIKDLDKVVGKLRTVIPRSLEITATPTGWKLQERQV